MAEKIERDEGIVEETGRELEPEAAEGLAGGGAPGGPICPVCSSSNVVIDFKRLIVTECRACGWKR